MFFLMKNLDLEEIKKCIRIEMIWVKVESNNFNERLSELQYSLDTSQRDFKQDVTKRQYTYISI